MLEFKTAANRTTPLAGLTPQVKLKPYLKSPIYGEQANELGRTPREEMEHDEKTMLRLISYTCDKIGDGLRSQKLRWGGKPNLESTWIYNYDLSNVDFADANLCDAYFRFVNLKSAIRQCDSVG
jgi:hypothetical protein